jgi:hypothetical protein
MIISDLIDNIIQVIKKDIIDVAEGAALVNYQFQDSVNYEFMDGTNYDF